MSQYKSYSLFTGNNVIPQPNRIKIQIRIQSVKSTATGCAQLFNYCKGCCVIEVLAQKKAFISSIFGCVWLYCVTVKLVKFVGSLWQFLIICSRSQTVQIYGVFSAFYLKKIVYLALPSPAAADTLASALLFTLNVIQSREFLGKLYF